MQIPAEFPLGADIFALQQGRVDVDLNFQGIRGEQISFIADRLQMQAATHRDDYIGRLDRQVRGAVAPLAGLTGQQRMALRQ